jgi:hypothetical protein
MLVMKKWRKEEVIFGVVESVKEYKILLLFGFIPIYISING